jgi:hypothetical protein
MLTREVLITTSHIYPPIPDRRFDWSAVTDSYEPGDPIGYGPTEADAIADLIANLEANEEDGIEIIAKVRP